jgi:quinol monooxygenase YgiN
MVIVGGSFQVDPSQRDAFIAERHEIMRRSRAEDGCLEYTFAADPLDDGRVVLFERWASQEALDAHLAGLTTDDGTQVSPTSLSIVVYTVSGEKTLA